MVRANADQKTAPRSVRTLPRGPCGSGLPILRRLSRFRRLAAILDLVPSVRPPPAVPDLWIHQLRAAPLELRPHRTRGSLRRGAPLPGASSSRARTFGPTRRRRAGVRTPPSRRVRTDCNRREETLPAVPANAHKASPPKSLRRLPQATGAATSPLPMLEMPQGVVPAGGIETGAEAGQADRSNRADPTKAGGGLPGMRQVPSGDTSNRALQSLRTAQTEERGPEP